MRLIPIASLACCAMFLCGCLYGDLNVYYKECSPDHPCPDGFVCVERPTSLTKVEGHCHTPADAPLCPAAAFCDQSLSWVEVCRDDEFSSSVGEDCAGAGLHCNPDTAQCAAECQSEADCAAGLCDTGTHLCRPMPNCAETGCPDSQFCLGDTICVPSPTEDAVTASGAPDLADCGSSDPPTEPETCDLTGRVTYFPLTKTTQTAGLKVILRPAGDPEGVIQEDIVESDEVDSGYGHYRFEQISTNTVYDIEIEAREATGDNDGTVTTILPGVGIRADRVDDGLYSLGLSVMRVSDFSIYSTDLFPGVESHRSLVIGRVTDCSSSGTPDELGNATVGLAVPPVAPGRIYYFTDSEQALVPDSSGNLQATTTKGYYGAAGVPACRNQVAFSAREGSSVVPLGTVSFVAKPGAAVIANMPAPGDRIPE